MGYLKRQKLGIVRCCCCIPCNHCSNWTWVVEEILAFGTRHWHLEDKNSFWTGFLLKAFDNLSIYLFSVSVQVLSYYFSLFLVYIARSLSLTHSHTFNTILFSFKVMAVDVEQAEMFGHLSISKGPAFDTAVL